MRAICKVCLLVIISVFLLSCAGGPPVISMEQVRGNNVVLPKGLKIETALDTVLSSARSRVGEKCSIHTTEPVMLGNKVLIPRGARIIGRVTKIKPPTAGLLKAKINLEFDRIEIRGRGYKFPAKTSMDMGDMAMKGGKAGGEYAAKETLKYFIPVMGTVFLAQDIKKGYDYVQEEKEITLGRGTPFIISLKKPVTIPLR